MIDRKLEPVAESTCWHVKTGSRSEAFKLKARQRAAEAWELRNLWTTLDQHIRDGVSDPNALLIAKALWLMPVRVSSLTLLREAQHRHDDLGDSYEWDARGNDPAIYIHRTPELRAALDARKTRGEYVFGGNVPIPRKNVYDAWVRVVDAAGVAHMSVHDIRRSVATLLNEKRVLARGDIKTLLGHTPADITGIHYLTRADHRRIRQEAAKFILGVATTPPTGTVVAFKKSA